MVKSSITYEKIQTKQIDVHTTKLAHQTHSILTKQIDGHIRIFEFLQDICDGSWKNGNRFVQI